MPSKARNFHVRLSDELYGELRIQADRLMRPATELVRQAIELWLIEQRKAMRRDAIAAYAALLAGTDADLDPDLEAAAREHLLAETAAGFREPRSLE